MHNKHKLGSADASSCYYKGWQHLMQPPSHNSNTNTGLPKLSPKLANQQISNSFWSNPKITLKQQKIFSSTALAQFTPRSTLSGLITPLTLPTADYAGNMDSINHIVLGYSHPTCRGIFINRHNTALSLCCEALSK
eukprot:1000116-Pelagomonas_calceolata.AAC.1